MNGVGDDLLIGKGAQIRHRAGAEHGVALLGRPGHHDNYRAVLFKGAARGRAPVVVENGAALGQHGLLEIVLSHLPAVAAVGEVIVKAGLFVLVHFELEPEGFCEKLLCKIVAGRAEAAGGDDYIRPAAGDIDALGKPLRVIPHHGVVFYVYSYLRQHEGYVPCVGVRRMAEKYLCADGEYLRIICPAHCPTFILSMPLSASSTRPSISSTDSRAATSCTLGFVLGCLGVNTVQQSS